MVFEVMRLSKQTSVVTSAAVLDQVEIIHGLPDNWPMTCAALRFPLEKDLRERREHARFRLAVELSMYRSGLRGVYWPNPGELRERIEITTDRLGKPHLFIGRTQGPGISFSSTGTTLWAAMCDAGYHCGIDVASSHEFGTDYPFHRAFRSSELENLRTATGEDAGEVAALLWSAKEALVKALGCGFHLLDPLRVEIRYRNAHNAALFLTAELHGRTPKKFPRTCLGTLRIVAFRTNNAWLSTALADREPASRKVPSVRQLAV